MDAAVGRPERHEMTVDTLATTTDLARSAGLLADDQVLLDATGLLNPGTAF